MGWPRVRCGWTSIDCASGLIFWLSLLGLAVCCGLAAWAYELKLRAADYLDAALPGGEGYLWPGALTAGLAFAAPVHLLGLGLRAPVARDIACRRLDRSAGRGRCLDRLLALHVALSCLSGLLVFGACAGSAFLWGYSRRRVKQGLYRALRRYPYDAAARARLDLMQLELRCCGVEAYSDWFAVPWDVKPGFSINKQSRLDEEHLGDRESIRRRQRRRVAAKRRRLSIDVPYSCCTPEASPCVHLGVGAGGHPAKGPWSISSRGCRAPVLDRAEEAGRQVVTCLFFLSIYQLTLSIVSRLLQTARMSAARPRAGDELFLAWVFGGSPSGQRCWEAEMQPLRDEDSDEDSTSSAESCPKRRLGAGGGGEPPPDRRFRDISRELAVAPRKQRPETRRDAAAQTKRRSPGGERPAKPNDASYRGPLKDTPGRRGNRSSRQAAMAAGRDDWRPVDKRKSCARRTSSSSCSSSSGSSSLPTLPPTPGPPNWSGARRCPVHPHSARRVAPDCPVHGDANRPRHWSRR